MIREPKYPSRFFSSLKSSYNDILVSTHPNLQKETGLSVGLIELNKPTTLNALSDSLFDDLIHALKAFDSMEDIGSIVVTGKGKAFAAGADIPEMSAKDFSQAYNSNMFSQWADICKVSKPIIAAVNGYALGGGCELAMMCDITIASSNARFGQPEVNLGIIPGAGGTQRLIRCLGKSKAMEMILTGEMIDADKAEREGLISKVVEKREDLVNEAIRYVICAWNVDCFCEYIVRCVYYSYRCIKKCDM
jgi:enoyl-CoA hydratase/carnithine racemase